MTAISRTKRPIFATARPRNSLRKRVFSYVTTTAVIALSTWGGVIVARELAGSDGMNSPMARAINRLVDDLLRMDPILSAVVAGVVGLVGLAFVLRNHSS